MCCHVLSFYLLFHKRKTRHYSLISCHMRFSCVTWKQQDSITLQLWWLLGLEMAAPNCVTIFSSHFTFLSFILSSNLFSSQSSLPENRKRKEVGQNISVFKHFVFPDWAREKGFLFLLDYFLFLLPLLSAVLPSCNLKTLHLPMHKMC